MSNRLEELHAQYKRYYLKKVLKVFGLAVVVFSLGLAGYLLLEYREPNSASKEPAVQAAHTPVQPNKNKNAIPKSQPSYVVSVPDDILEKSVKTIEMKSDKVETPKRATPKEQTQPVFVKTAPADEKKFDNYFAKPTEIRSIDSWIEKYNQKKSYSLAISIAKQYYKENDFKQSGIWAKRANQLDRDKEDAWLYYAKSVHAMGDVQKAKKILNIYLQYKESDRAELLLTEWEQ